MVTSGHLHSVRLLDEDPELGEGLAPAQFEAARGVLTATELTLPAGPWRHPASGTGLLGLLVLDGTLGCRITLQSRTHMELVGGGDVIQPWVGLVDEPGLPPEVDWQLLTPTRVALLDRRFAHAATAYPEVIAALMHRLVLRSRRLSLQMAVNSIPRIGERLELILWHFAGRWGRMTSEGVVLDLPITHQVLAEIAGAQRPSVSTALAGLREAGRLEHEGRSDWRLLGDPPSTLHELRGQVGLPADPLIR